MQDLRLKAARVRQESGEVRGLDQLRGSRFHGLSGSERPPFRPGVRSRRPLSCSWSCSHRDHCDGDDSCTRQGPHASDQGEVHAPSAASNQCRIVVHCRHFVQRASTPPIRFPWRAGGVSTGTPSAAGRSRYPGCARMRLRKVAAEKCHSSRDCPECCKSTCRWTGIRREGGTRDFKAYREGPVR